MVFSLACTMEMIKTIKTTVCYDLPLNRLRTNGPTKGMKMILAATCWYMGRSSPRLARERRSSMMRGR